MVAAHARQGIQRRMVGGVCVPPLLGGQAVHAVVARARSLFLLKCYPRPHLFKPPGVGGDLDAVLGKEVGLSGFHRIKAG